MYGNSSIDKLIQSIDWIDKLQKAFMGLIVFFVIAFLVLFGSLLKRIQDRNAWEALNKQGQTQVVQLTNVEKDTCGRIKHRYTCYRAFYVYQGDVRREKISKEQYEALLNAPTVEIIADGDTSQISSPPPDYRIAAQIKYTTIGSLLLLLLCTLCFLATHYQLETYRQQIKSIKNKASYLQSSY